MGRWKLNSFGLIQVPANSSTCLSAPGCRALCSSPGLCAVTPRSSHGIYCQVKAFASFLTIQVCTKTHICVCEGNCQGISEKRPSGARARALPAGAEKTCWGQRAPQSRRHGPHAWEREEGSENTLQPVFAGSKRHMHRRSKWHEVNEQRSIKQRCDRCSRSSISSRLPQVAAVAKRRSHVTESKLTCLMLKDWS